jgi:hypothetical protein
VATEYLAGESGILVVAGYAVAAIYVLRRLRPRAETVRAKAVAVP